MGAGQGGTRPVGAWTSWHVRETSRCYVKMACDNIGFARSHIACPVRCLSLMYSCSSYFFRIPKSLTARLNATSQDQEQLLSSAHPLEQVKAYFVFRRERHYLTAMDQSPLGRLPAELRKIIYYLALLNGNDEGKDKDVLMSKDNSRLRRPPSLHHCCRQLRLEARSLYYTVNTFRFTSSHCARLNPVKYHLKHRLRALGAAQRSLIRKICLDRHYDCNPGAMAEGRIKGCRSYLRRRGISISQVALSVNVRGMKRRQIGRAWGR